MAVFISYHSSKRAVVEHMANYFARHDISTWYAPRDVPPGSSWDEAISHAIRESTALVLLFCASADSSVHVKREIHLADKAKIPIYWVRLEKVQPERLGYYLAPTQWVDWLDQRDSTLDALVGDLKRPSVEGRALEPKRGATPTRTRLSTHGLRPRLPSTTIGWLLKPQHTSTSGSHRIHRTEAWSCQPAEPPHSSSAQCTGRHSSMHRIPSARRKSSPTRRHSVSSNAITPRVPGMYWRR